MQPDDRRSFVFEALNRLPVVLAVLDAEGRYVLAEGGGLERLGLAPGELVGRLAAEVYPNTTLLDAIRDTLEGRNFEGKIAIGEATYQASVQPLTRDGIVMGVIGVAFDVTERERSEGLLASVVEESTDAIVLASAAGRILRFSPAAERMFGYTAADILDRPVLRLVVPEFRERYSEGIDHPEMLNHWFRVRGLRVDGDEFPLDLHLSRVAHDHGEPVFVAVMRDARADEASRQARETLLAAVSHEFRTPLTAISMFIELARTGAVLPPEVAGYLDVIARNVTRLERLVEDLIYLGAGIEELHVVEESVDLPALVREAVTLARPAAAAAAIALDCQDAPGGRIAGDPVRLGQLFDNLLGNAVKFSPAGGTIAVRCRPDSEAWTVTVINSGANLRPSELQSVFDPFTRGSAAIAIGAPGQGLGLAIARAIVERHGGSIDLTSSRAAGTTVSVRLPFVRAPGAGS